jgi:hypothetical protein
VSVDFSRRTDRRRLGGKTFRGVASMGLGFAAKLGREMTTFFCAGVFIRDQDLIGEEAPTVDSKPT